MPESDLTVPWPALRAVFQHAPLGIVYFPADPRGEVFGNPAAERLLGRITRGNDPARTFDLRHADGRPVREEELPSTRALREEAVVSVEALIDRGGVLIPTLLCAAPVREAGTQVGAVVIFQDVTTLEQLRRQRQDFLALVAHDLRTPLQSVLLQLEALLQRGDEAVSVAASALRLMKRNADRLERLVRDLLDAAQIESHGVQLDLAPVRLPDLVTAVVAQIERSLGPHPVVIEVEGDPPAIAADAVRIEQIVTNLLENAAKYSEEGTTIRIRIAPAGRGAALSVMDHGFGIAPEELPRLFDRYFQAERARAKRRGLGLGLFITRGLVQAHGGTIDVESVPRSGSTFRIWLPEP